MIFDEIKPSSIVRNYFSYFAFPNLPTRLLLPVAVQSVQAASTARRAHPHAPRSPSPPRPPSRRFPCQTRRARPRITAGRTASSSPAAARCYKTTPRSHHDRQTAPALPSPHLVDARSPGRARHPWEELARSSRDLQSPAPAVTRRPSRRAAHVASDPPGLTAARRQSSPDPLTTS